MTGATRRINRGNGHSYELDGEKVDGVTTILNDGVPKRALVDWAARTVAGYAVDHWADLDQRPTSERLRTLERAHYESRNAAAARGTVIHDLADQLARGVEVEVPDEVAGHVDAYLAFVRDWRPVEVLTEAVVINRRRRYMGTLDVVARLADGATWLLDFKTGASGVFPETALQLSAYRYAETFLDDDGREHPMPATERTGAIWLRADGYALLPVETDEGTFRAFLYAQQVARWCRRGRRELIGDALAPPPRLEAVQ